MAEAIFRNIDVQISEKMLNFKYFKVEPAHLDSPEHHQATIRTSRYTSKQLSSLMFYRTEDLIANYL